MVIIMIMPYINSTACSVTCTNTEEMLGWWRAGNIITYTLRVSTAAGHYHTTAAPPSPQIITQQHSGYNSVHFSTVERSPGLSMNVVGCLKIHECYILCCDHVMIDNSVSLVARS